MGDGCFTTRLRGDLHGDEYGACVSVSLNVKYIYGDPGQIQIARYIHTEQPRIRILSTCLIIRQRASVCNSTLDRT